MEFDYTTDYIKFENKDLSDLDKFVKKFLNVLENYFDYVLISGYVAIMFGRSRSSEGVDVIIEKTDYDKCKKILG